MTKCSERVLIGVLGFGLGSVVATQVARGQDTHPIDGPLTHVGIVVRDVETSARAFGDAFGVEVPPPTVASGLPVPGGAAAQVKLTNLVKDSFRIELLEPVGGPSPWQEFLDERGEGVHHLGVRVADVGAAIAFLEDQGGRLVLGNAGVDFGYMDMAPELGVTIEVMGPNLGQ
jgi:catechol 2,3-dioxygenase-like lactoylglutathione lyase family enzyme